MFRESLLESSRSRKRKRWPMAAAFAGEIIIAGLLVLIPFLTTAVIQVSAHVVELPPLARVRVVPRDQPGRTSHGGVVSPARPVIFVPADSHRVITANDSREQDPRPEIGVPEKDDEVGIKNALASDHYVPPISAKAPHHPIISASSEARLLNKVEPVYPRIAVLSGRQGDVKLHAVIAKDGTIESLTVISGDPMLVPSTLEAVRQWRYRPYILNGEPVEVETFITVSFKGIRN